MPIVSVILPNHNYADFISDAINSVRAQTLSDIECIIIDDASTDNSVNVIKNLIQDDKRFKLIELSEPVGVSVARNMALDIANGEYIAFLDSDDCYTEYALEMLVKLARTSNYDVVGGRAQFINGHFKWGLSKTAWDISNYNIEKDFTKMLLAPSNQKWIWIWRRIYKRSLLKDVRFPSDMKINGDDISFMLDIGWRINGIAEVSFPTVYHRIHPLSITANKTKLDHERISVFPLIFQRVRDNALDKYGKDCL